MGAFPREVRLTGGAARVARRLRTILAAALGTPVRAGSRGEEAGAAGAAMIAAVSDRRLSGHGGLRRRLGDAAAWRAHGRRMPQLAAALRADVSRSISKRARPMRPVWRALPRSRRRRADAC